MPQTPSRTLLLLVALALAGVTFAVYVPSLSFGFVSWDDHRYVFENPYIRSIDLNLLRNAFTKVVSGNLHPLTIISHAFDYAIWGLTPLGHHLTNNILHALDTALVFHVAFRLFNLVNGEALRWRSLIAAAAASALFGLHPLHVESVSWVSERKDVLSALFFILTVNSYLSYSIKGGGRHYLSSLFFFVLALLSKPMAMTMPFVLILIDYYPLGRLGKGAWGRAVIEKIPFLVLSVASGLSTLYAQKAANAVMAMESYPLPYRITVAVKAYVFYIYKLILPFGLAPLYPMPQAGEFFNALFFISAVILAALSVLVIISRRGYLISSWFYYVITLGPVIGIIQVGSQSAADRYSYLPSIGLFMLFGGAVARAIDGGVPVVRKALWGVLILTGVALSVLTIRQEAIWKDSVSLWTREVEAFPAFATGLNYRGSALNEAGRYDEAIADLTRAIELEPRNDDAYNNRGIAYQSKRDYERAIGDFVSAIKISPSKPMPYHNLSIIYSDLGEVELSLAASQKAQALGYR